MIFDLKPYAAMKESGVPWLGNVPEHWEVRRLKSLLSVRITDGPHVTPEFVPDGIPFLSVDGIQCGELVFKGCRYVSLQDHAEFRKKTAPRRNDILFGKAASTGKIARVKVDFEFSIWSPLALIRPNESQILPGFLEYALKDVSAQTQIETLCTLNTQKNISMDDIPKLILPLPPLPEQTVIVRHFDYMDRRIRKYIRAKQKLIKLLEEQKQAIIYRAVTRGLTPNVRLKPSGVEWMGDVPEHWEVKRCRYIFREVDERSVDGSEKHLSMSQRLGLVPSHLVENRTLVSESYAGAKLCKVGDLVLNRLKAHLGVFALAQYAGVISLDYTVLRPIDPSSPKYFELVLRSPACRGELRTRAKGIVEGFWRLYTDDFYDIRLPVPPCEERDAIIEYIRITTTEIDSGVSGAEREISLLREYRTRLIADVVTGKLDVREAAARLHDEAEEPELVDEGDAMSAVDDEPVDDLGTVPEEVEA